MPIFECERKYFKDTNNIFKFIVLKVFLLWKAALRIDIVISCMFTVTYCCCWLNKSEITKSTKMYFSDQKIIMISKYKIYAS
jgi:hypothetical protein